MNAQRRDDCRPTRIERASRRWFALFLCLLLPAVAAVVNASPATAAPSNCISAMKIEDRGNTKYAWLYITNTTNKSARMTVEKSWDYKGERRKSTHTLTLAPKASREVFSFPRKQRPRLSVLACSND